MKAAVHRGARGGFRGDRLRRARLRVVLPEKRREHSHEHVRGVARVLRVRARVEGVASAAQSAQEAEYLGRRRRRARVSTVFVKRSRTFVAGTAVDSLLLLRRERQTPRRSFRNRVFREERGAGNGSVQHRRERSRDARRRRRQRGAAPRANLLQARVEKILF